MSDLEIKPPREPAPFTPPPGRKIELHEDTGSLALSEALKSVFGVLKLIMLAVIVFFVFSGVFTVEPNEVAVLLRFGKPVGVGESRILKPGLHFSFPYPVDEVVRIPVGKSHTVKSDIGWYYESPEDIASGNLPNPGNGLSPERDGYLLTADGNVIHARATLKYRVIDPVRHVFYYANATDVLRNILNHALLRAAAEFTAEAALYKDKIAFRESVIGHINSAMALLPMGVRLEPIDVQTSPPLKVKDSFDQVISAEQMRSEQILKAQAGARESIQLASGEAKSVIASGMIRSNQLVTSIEAEARSFEAQLPYFRKDPDLFVRRVAADSLRIVLTNANDKFFVPTRADGTSRELRIQLSREPMKATDREK
ncbi:MAG: hypothetical protein ISQ14_00270 [Verrucomicrobiae bacterium]|jgi:membrane protease subunit HflK|nr:hypothetical protein [Verrucomicrobiae bacterium]